MNWKQSVSSVNSCIIGCKVTAAFSQKNFLWIKYKNGLHSIFSVMLVPIFHREYQFQRRPNLIHSTDFDVDESVFQSKISDNVFIHITDHPRRFLGPGDPNNPIGLQGLFKTERLPLVGLPFRNKQMNKIKRPCT